MSKKYRLKVEQLGLPAGAEFTEHEDGYRHIGEWGVTTMSRAHIKEHPNLFEPVVERFRPKVGERYWTVLYDGEVGECQWYGSNPDHERWERNVVFRRQDDAKEAAIRIKAVLTDYQYELAKEDHD